MTSMMERNQGKRAAAKRTDKFILVETYSGRGLLGRDFNSGCHLLSVTATNEELGWAVRDALSKSRFLSVGEAQEFLAQDRVKQAYEKWVGEMVDRFGFKSRKDLFKNMISCDIRLVEEEIVLRPTSHPKLEAWEGRGDEVIVKTGEASDAAIGQALRLAFDRCES